MKYLGFPFYPVHQIVPNTYFNLDIIHIPYAPSPCILSGGDGVQGRNRSVSDIPLYVGDCPFRPFASPMESIFYLKKYLNPNQQSPMDTKYYYEIRSYAHGMSLGVSTEENGTWVPWDDSIEYAYLVDEELPNDSPYLNPDTDLKKSISWEFFGWETELEYTQPQGSLALTGFRNLLLVTQCVWFDSDNILVFRGCGNLMGWGHVALPVYTPPGIPYAADEIHHPRLDLINTNARAIPPYVGWWPFREGINVYYTCYEGCLVVYNDTMQVTHDFDFDNLIQ